MSLERLIARSKRYPIRWYRVQAWIAMMLLVGSVVGHLYMRWLSPWKNLPNFQDISDTAYQINLILLTYAIYAYFAYLVRSLIAHYEQHRIDHSGS